jgi:hypothetical protein
MRVLRYGFNVMVTLVMGTLLARYVANLPVEWPWLTGSIRFVLGLFNVHAYDNPDDMFDLASVVIFFVCVIIVGLVVWAVNFGARLYLRAARR